MKLTQFFALLVSLIIIGCGSEDKGTEKQTGTTTEPVTEPSTEPATEPATEPQTADQEESTETAYVEKTGEARVIPLAFKEYQEWGEFVYNDQLLEMYQKQMEELGDTGDAAKIAELTSQILKVQTIKESAFKAMSKRLSEK